MLSLFDILNDFIWMLTCMKYICNDYVFISDFINNFITPF